MYQIVVNKELKLIETDQNKIKSQFESLKKLVLPHLSKVEKTCEKNLFFFPYRMSIMSGPSTKKRRSIEDVRVLKNTDFGVIEKDNKALCIFCLKRLFAEHLL